MSPPGAPCGMDEASWGFLGNGWGLPCTVGGPTAIFQPALAIWNANWGVKGGLGSNSPDTLLLPNLGSKLGSKSGSGEFLPRHAFTPQFGDGHW